ncbi:MAG: cysteine desulfurase family protein [Rhodomicrobium sp.]
MKTRCYLDHNATSPLRPEARAAIARAFDCIGNPSSIHAEGRAARRIVEDARETVAAIFEVAASQVYFTGSGTEAANWLLQPRGDETLAVSAVEHPCVLSGHRFDCLGSRPPHPVLLPEGRRDARILAEDSSGVLSPLGERDRVRGDFAQHSSGFRIVPVFEDGTVDLDALEAALASGSIAAVQAANNETGVIQPIAEIANVVHSKGAVLICDAVQAIGRLPLSELKDADVLFFSAHKFGGPKGAGAAIFRNPDFAPAPLLRGGGQERRQRSGTENVPGIAGLAAALEVAVSEQAAFAAKAKVVQEKLECGIRNIAPDAVIFGSPSASQAATPFLDGALNEGISPHPVPLPASSPWRACRSSFRIRKRMRMGEGTPEIALRVIQGSLLPWGEGQDEGSELRAGRLPNTTCFAIPGKSAEVSLIAFDLEGVAVSSGSACSSGKVERSHVLAAMGVPAELSRGAIRVSTGWTTAEADIERFLAVLSKICESRTARHGICSSPGESPHAGHAV